MSATEKLATFIVDTNFENIPSEGIDVVKKVSLDCLGVTLSGYEHPMGKIITDFVRESGGTPKATVLGPGFKTSPADAALANGTMAHALDYDDYSLELYGHPSVSLLPAILALGEDRGISGKKAIEAYVIGFEVESKIGAGVNPKHYLLGWHATCTLGTMGAAAACSAILGLDIEKTRIALGIAASEAGGLRQNFGTMTKPLHAGLSARNGVIAALLAEKGFTADKNILEADFGLCNVFCGKGEYKLEAITEKLGNPYAILKPGISIKPYPSCGGTHTGLDAMLHLVKTNDIHPEDIEEVHVLGSELLPQVLIHSDPKSGLEGKFSMQYCMAISLLDKKAGLEQFTDERVRDPKVAALVKKVKLLGTPDMSVDSATGSVPVEVTVKLKNGKEYSRRVDVAKGNPDMSLSQEEIKEKFKDCSRLLLPEEKSNRVIELVAELENLGDIKELMNLLI